MDLRLDQLNILIGANGAGKTNFISIFRLLNAIVEGELQQYVVRHGGASSLLHYGRKSTDQLVVKLEFGANLYDVVLGIDQDDQLFFEEEVAYVWDRVKYPNRPFKDFLGSNHRESKLNPAESISRHVVSAISSWRLYHFHDTSDSADVKQTGRVDDSVSLASNARNLAAYLLMLRLQHPENYRQIVDAVQLAAPFFDDFVLTPQGKNSDRVRLAWRQRGSDVVLSLAISPTARCGLSV